MRRENFAIFSLDKLKTQPDGEECYVCFLSGATRALLLSALRYTAFLKTRWFVGDESLMGVFTDEERDEIEQFYENAKTEVIMGCSAEDFIKVQRMMVAALTAEAVDLSTPLPASVDYTAVGVSKRLEEIKDILTAAAGETDDLEEILDALQVVLGGIAILA